LGFDVLGVRPDEDGSGVISATVTGTDEELIRQVVADQVRAMRAGDAEALVARFAAEVVSFGLAPPLVARGVSVRGVEGLRGWFAGFSGPVDFRVRDLAVTVGGGVAFCHSLNWMSATPRGMSEPFELWFRSTVGLVWRDGRWLVAHEHMSTPFHMDGSLRAAVDLRP
jgi:ketosteroid isomerase-like protein